MLAYASHRRPIRRIRPTTLMLIVGGHAVMLAAVMAIRAEVVGPRHDPPITIFTPIDPVPPPPIPTPPVKSQPTTSTITTPPRQIVIQLPQGPLVVDPPDPVPTNDTIGTAIEIKPLGNPLTVLPHVIVRSGPRLLTSGAMIRPPYPDSKIRSEEEAVLRLRLAIGPDGRVTGVEPVGAADPAFLAAARAHLLRVWRYFPAKEGDRAVATSIVITLRFELSE